MLGEWLVGAYGGGGGATGRACGGGASEHKDGRAIDWTLDATKPADRRIAKAFLKAFFATDEDGNTHALARRMGIMYVIWNDRMYSAWDQFEPEPYLSSSCKSKKKCSKTLRHRDHMHISLSRPGAKGKTSWYEGRAQRPAGAPRLSRSTRTASRRPRRPCGPAGRCRSRTAGSAGRSASAPGCARTSRRCAHR